MSENTFWVLLGVALLLDLLVIAMRASLVHVRLPQLINLRERAPARVERTLKLLDRPHLPAALRVAVVSARFWFVGLLVLALVQTNPGIHIAILVGALLVAWLILLGLEFIIEGMVLRRVEPWTLWLMPLAEGIEWLLRPITWLLMRLMGPVSALQRLRAEVTEDELKSWVEEGQPEGTLEVGERKMIYSIFQFGETLCREIMVPRIDVFALEVDTPLSQALPEIIRSGHSRLPVYEGSIDNVIGLLYTKDLLRLQPGAPEAKSLRPLLRQAFFVPEAKKVDELLREMQERGVHIAVVVDEYGGMAGLVTLEDIVEEIVGEIRDEYDQSEESPFQQVGPQEYIFQGRTSLDDLNDILGTHLTKEVADTLAGFIYQQVGRIPAGGEQIEVEGWLLTVEQVSGRRIRLVRARRSTIDETEEGQHESER